jgi:ATP-dependent Lhr-like helicase
MKRTFRNCAIIAGLIERRFPGEEKSRRQVTISTDLVYDVLRSHSRSLLLRAARADAATGFSTCAARRYALAHQGANRHKALDHVSPLAVRSCSRSAARRSSARRRTRCWPKRPTSW